MKCLEKANSEGQKINQGLLQVEGRKKIEETDKGYKISFWGDENILKLDSGDSTTTLNILTTDLYLKRANRVV